MKLFTFFSIKIGEFASRKQENDSEKSRSCDDRFGPIVKDSFLNDFSVDYSNRKSDFRTEPVMSHFEYSFPLKKAFSTSSEIKQKGEYFLFYFIKN